jgi:hypothetical protein
MSPEVNPPPRPTPVRWLLLSSPDYRFRAFLALEKAGHVVVNPPPMESTFSAPRGGRGRTRGDPFEANKSAAELAERPRTLPELPELPDAVFVDHNVTKFRFMLAGFWRGIGLPVVYLRHPRVDNWSDMERLARDLGMFSVHSLDHFERWLRTGPTAPACGRWIPTATPRSRNSTGVTPMKDDEYLSRLRAAFLVLLKRPCDCATTGHGEHCRAGAAGMQANVMLIDHLLGTSPRADETFARLIAAADAAGNPPG